MPKRRVVKHSKGEILCGKILKTMVNGTVINQFPLGPYYFDFMCIHNGKQYLIEYDGIQHFQFVQFIHRKEANFKSRQRGDVNKTAIGIINGYIIIRIDYKQDTEEKIREHLNNAFVTSEHIYVSSKELYTPMLKSEIKANIRDLALRTLGKDC